MDSKHIRYMLEAADSSFIRGLVYMERNDLIRAYRNLAVSRALNIYLERGQMLTLSNFFLELGAALEFITDKEKRDFQKYGEEKVRFLVGLGEGGKSFLEDILNEQSKRETDGKEETEK